MAGAMDQEWDPRRWREHRFGLSAQRWAGLAGLGFWITGAGTGYGRSLACALAAAGCRVVLTGRRPDKLEQSLAEMRACGIDSRDCRLLPCDLTQEEQILAACQQVREISPTLRGVVNNAALPSKPGSRFPLGQDPPEYWHRLMATNLTAPWLLTRSALPHMLATGGARVVFVSSEAGWAGTCGVGMYNVSKAALNSLGYSMAEEFAARYPRADIQINVLVPGEALTEMNQGSRESPYRLTTMALLLLSHPPGGPTGRFFHRDGRSLGFGYAQPYGPGLDAGGQGPVRRGEHGDESRGPGVAKIPGLARVVALKSRITRYLMR